MEEKPLIILKELYGNPPPELHALQNFLAPHSEFLTNAWISIWIATAITVLTILVREYRTWKHSDK